MMRFDNLAFILLGALLLAPLGVIAGAQQAAGSASRPAAAAPLKNPIPSDVKSVAIGKLLFAKQCSQCHGAIGKGDGKSGALLKPRPADMTDDSWLHGGSDADIFATIRNGVPQTGMRGFKGRLTETETWNIINFLRTLRVPRGREG
jgi:mono/diheme cytochrome c family protein